MIHMMNDKDANMVLVFTDYAKALDCVDQSLLWKTMTDMTPTHHEPSECSTYQSKGTVRLNGQ